eukprot:CAMPEP_0201588240 /NCGR_PEP_ID=MMETSP0190_2-20130828/152841_1 /ASSEMBLY_ACC=CAM_ASM_000263 /TAXON_ID=37353 /ORGANISM="Rosalina sp." /LENGTH=176 /DNA_ID=CAMNT_0048039975 /DNA_START=566 /DNA_END=1096 /DNA_ORIENTATION=+
MEEQKYPPMHDENGDDNGDHSLLGLPINSNNLNHSIASNMSQRSMNGGINDALTSSSESNKSNKSNHSNHSYHVIDKDEVIKEEDETDIKQEEFLNDDKDEKKMNGSNLNGNYLNGNSSNNNDIQISIQQTSQQLDIPRSKGMILKPKSVNNSKTSQQLPSYSMPSKLQTIRPING